MDAIKLANIHVAARPDVGGSVVINAGSGNDKVEISGLSVAAATATGAGGSVSIVGGDGRDQIDLRDPKKPRLLVEAGTLPRRGEPADRLRDP